MKNYGLKFDTPSPEHYVFGAINATFPVIQEDANWTPYLPVREQQNLNGVETYACVTYTLLHCVEILIKQKYGLDRNYSERFLASISGTKEGGNSPQTVCEFLRQAGVVTEDLFPFDSTITTFNQYYSPIPASLKQLAKEFNDEWVFKHAFVIPDALNISAALKTSPLMVTVAAWFPRDGKYYRPEGYPDNHATTLIYEEQGALRRVFDSYDSFIKDLDWAMLPTVAKCFFIEKNVQLKKNWLSDLLTELFSFFKDLWIKTT